jgi:EAL domain-containing protein (putative c-di-GMP-specific phosphodiesterase class I)
MDNLKHSEITLDDVKSAINNKELVVYYQPQYDIITNNISGAEALVRWIRSDGTFVMPGSFIPMVEKSELILELDWYVLNEVCCFLRRCIDNNEKCIKISSNFSRMHLLEDDFKDKLYEIVDKHNIPHNLIEVELTESAIMENPKNMIDTIENIRNNGFDVAIDDFGSGLSSLSLIKDISANVLKIDKSLLSGNCENEKERIVLESIFNFAQRLDMTTIAEGVETQQQLGFLKTCGCSLIQGFIFSKPMPECDFIKICSENILYKSEDILFNQTLATSTEMLIKAIFMKYPLVIMANLTRNSYYMMAYDNFSTRECASTGIFDELIYGGSKTMYPDDEEIFRNTFSKENLIEAYSRGEQYVRLVTRQLGDDGVYRRVETVDYFVKNPSVDDILVVVLCQNLDD